MRNVDAVLLDTEFDKIMDEALTAAPMMFDLDRIQNYMNTANKYGERYPKIGSILYKFNKGIRQGDDIKKLKGIGLAINIFIGVAARFESGKFKIIP